MGNLRAALAAAAVVVALALTGCASGVVPSDAFATAAPAALTADEFVAKVTAAAKTAKTFHLDASILQGSQTVLMAADVKPGASAGANPDMSATISVSGQKVAMILTGGKAYLNAGAQTDGKYVTLTADQLGQVFGSSGNPVSGLAPDSQLDGIKDAITQISSKPGGTLDGVATTEYDLVIDLAKADSAFTDGEKLSGTAKVQYWLGSDDLPRKVVETMSGSTTTMTLGKWGEAVTIAAPDAGEIISPDQLSSGG